MLNRNKWTAEHICGHVQFSQPRPAIHVKGRVIIIYVDMEKQKGPLVSVNQFSSVTQSCPTLCDPMDCSMLGFPVLLHLQELLKLMSTESVMPFNYLNLCFPFLLLLSIFPRIRVFPSESALTSGGQSIRASASALVL